MSNGTELGRTLILIKPDAIERGLTGEIIKRFERKGFRIVKAEMRLIDEELAKKHYAEHQHNAPYFSKMIEAITHGPVVAMILEGWNAVDSSRQLIGSASPSHSTVGTIRGDLAYEEAFNLVHGSDSNSAAYREICLWFNPEDYWPENTDTKLKKKWELKFGGPPMTKNPWNEVPEEYYDDKGYDDHYDDDIIPIVPIHPIKTFGYISSNPNKEVYDLLSTDKEKGLIPNG